MGAPAPKPAHYAVKPSPPSSRAWRGQHVRHPDEQCVVAALAGAVTRLAAGLGGAGQRRHVRPRGDRAARAVGQNIVGRVCSTCRFTLGASSFTPRSVGRAGTLTCMRPPWWASPLRLRRPRRRRRPALRASSLAFLVQACTLSKPLCCPGRAWQVSAARDPLPAAVRPPSQHRPALWLVPRGGAHLLGHGARQVRAADGESGAVRELGWGFVRCRPSDGAVTRLWDHPPGHQVSERARHI